MPATEVTLFVACYNEAPNIVATLDTVAAALRSLDISYDVVVIDDASTDGSADLVAAYARAHPEVPIDLRRNRRNRGLARNFAAAAFIGRGRYFKLVCGDNVESEEVLRSILEQRGTADVIVPYHDICAGRTPERALLSRVFTSLVNALSGYSLRYYNGLQLLRRADVMAYHSRSRGFGFQADLITRLLDRGASYREVRVEARDRTHGASKALTLLNFLAVSETLLRIGGRRLARMGRLTRSETPAPQGGQC